jgi:hypothetical protein
MRNDLSLARRLFEDRQEKAGQSHRGLGSGRLAAPAVKPQQAGKYKRSKACHGLTCPAAPR